MLLKILKRLIPISITHWILSNIMVTSPPNSTPKRFPSYLLLTFVLYFFFIFNIPRSILSDFPSNIHEVTHKSYSYPTLISLWLRINPIFILCRINVYEIQKTYRDRLIINRHSIG